VTLVRPFFEHVSPFIHPVFSDPASGQHVKRMATSIDAVIAAALWDEE
jgi:hypothetical protein